MNFIEAIFTCFKKAFTIEGRAARAEYWYYHLFVFILNMVYYVFLAFVIGLLSDAAAMPQQNLKFILLSLVGAIIVPMLLLIPSFSVTVRRLHDINLSGWYYLIYFIPWVGAFIMLYFTVKDGDYDTNQYGEAPYAT